MINFIGFRDSEQFEQMKLNNPYSELKNGLITIIANDNNCGSILIRCKNLDYLCVKQYALCSYPQPIFHSDGCAVSVDKDIVTKVETEIIEYSNDLLMIVNNAKIINDCYISNAIVKRINTILEASGVENNIEFSLWSNNTDFSLSVKENDNNNYEVCVGGRTLYTLNDINAAEQIISIIQRDLTGVIKLRYPQQINNDIESL